MRLRIASDDEEADSEADSDAGPRWVAERVPVEVGLMDTEWAEVTSGIDAGDDVIVIGQSNLRDGAPVRTPDMAAATPRSPEDAG